jgi:uncharacterized protein YdeI (YjbR/CyaY-like superfamily)
MVPVLEESQLAGTRHCRHGAIRYRRAMAVTNPKVDAFIARAQQWKPEMEALRAIALDCQLNEEIKWGKPCYTYDKSNVVIIQGFKEYVALLFFKGALLTDPDGVLTKTGANTVVGRQLRFTNLGEIKKLKATLKAYINEAIEVAKKGLKVDVTETAELTIPDELQLRLDEQPALNAAFHALTPGRQRAYIYHFSGAKQSATRQARVDKAIPQILKGKGLND